MIANSLAGRARPIVMAGLEPAIRAILGNASGGLVESGHDGEGLLQENPA